VPTSPTSARRLTLREQLQSVESGRQLPLKILARADFSMQKGRYRSKTSGGGQITMAII
jgi:hypothetical protein